MRKEILICDNCKSEHNELNNPVRNQSFKMIYRFDLCEKCYEKLHKIDEETEKEFNAIKDKCKEQLKKEVPEIHKRLYPKEAD